MSDKIVTIYHSPDADDAFMFYGLSCGAVQRAGFRFEHELCDIETLNQRALRGEIDCTAASVHACAYLSTHYSILRCGASMGGSDYGPCLIASSERELQLKDLKRIAIPGAYTSATLALKLFLREQKHEAELINLPFDKVGEAVTAGQVDAGVIIHEGQLTYEKDGFSCLADFGRWWWQKHKLPLPLGVNIVKRSLGQETLQAVASALKQSIQYGLEHRNEALQYAQQYGRGLTQAEADTFVSMYVNDWTLEMGEEGMRSIALFLKTAKEADLIPAYELNFI